MRNVRIVEMTRAQEFYVSALPGSLQDIDNRVGAAVRSQYGDIGPSKPGKDYKYVNVLGTFDDKVVFSVEQGKHTSYYSAEWSMSAAGEVMLKPAMAVKMACLFTAASASDVPASTKVATEMGRRNSTRDEASLMLIVEEAVRLLGAEKVMDKIRSLRNAPGKPAKEACGTKPRLYRKPKATL
jgi:hypothetical protein